MRFTWKNRQQYIQKSADWILDEFEQAPDFDIAIELVVDFYLDEFSYNPEWIGFISFKRAKKSILNRVYSQAERAEKYSKKLHPGLINAMKWAERGLHE